MWEQKIFTIRKTAGKCPQESYAVVVRVIHSEWILLKCASWDTGNLSAVVENIILEKNLPPLFFEKTEFLSPNVVGLSTMTVKKYELVILNPVT